MISKRILWVGNFLPQDKSLPSVSRELTDHLAKKGWTILVTSTKTNRLLRYTDMLFTVFKERKKYAIAHIDIYSGWAFLWAESVALLLRLIKKPYLVTLHGGGLPEFAGRYPRRVSKVLKSAQAIIAPSGYLCKKMEPYARNIQIIPNALDLKAYVFRLRKPIYPRLIWLRAFHQVYNPALAVEVLALLAHKISNISLLMIGPDKKDGALEKTKNTAIKLGVVDKITFMNGVKKFEVPKMLAQGDIFLNTTNVDNTPVSVIEALACGLCVVSTDVGGIPYLLQNEENALLVPPDNPEEMSRAVNKLIENPDLAEKLSKSARKRAEDLDWENILSKWQAVLTRILETV